MTAHDAVTRGRAAFDRKAWSEAYRELALADRQTSLTPEDLDSLATAAYLVGEEPATRAPVRMPVLSNEVTLSARRAAPSGLATR
ncbi:MAG TPA: hypothetical protein VFB99_06245 [Vicinamibacterales bacterium]|jgi:hypothetical protein|nr:hypothetical protein [Vicinamibacterales bacterium]